jgi:hypothetical protein
MGYELLADFIVTVHFAYVAFVVVGQILILIGVALKWSWIRNFWFRLAHVIAITLVGVEAVFQIDCPLTVWEGQLRTLTGKEVAEGSFVGRLFHNLLFYNAEQWIFDVLHICFALLVIATLVLIPPRWPKLSPAKQSACKLPNPHTTSDAASNQR